MALVAVAAFAGRLGLAIGGSRPVSAVRTVNFQFKDFYSVGS